MAPVCRPILEARMNKYKEGEIHFNLMGVVEDKIARYNRWMAVNCKASLSGNDHTTRTMFRNMIRNDRFCVLARAD
jgi:hypothetical protein